MWHSDRPVTQQRLALSLSELVLPLPRTLFVPFLAAFWSTIISQYPQIDSLRLDKFLLLIRNYVNVAFNYLGRCAWDRNLLEDYIQIVEKLLLEEQGKVSDGLRYHVLDVWLVELDKADQERQCPIEIVMKPIMQLEKEGRTKVVRERAKECTQNEVLGNWKTRAEDIDGGRQLS